MIFFNCLLEIICSLFFINIRFLISPLFCSCHGYLGGISLKKAVLVGLSLPKRLISYFCSTNYFLAGVNVVQFSRRPYSYIYSFKNIEEHVNLNSNSVLQLVWNCAGIAYKRSDFFFVNTNI